MSDKYFNLIYLKIDYIYLEINKTRNYEKRESVSGIIYGTPI